MASANPTCNVEISDVALNISSNLLFCEETKVSLYQKPELHSEKLGWIMPPGEVLVIRWAGNYAKIKLAQGAAWILKRNLDRDPLKNKTEELPQ